MQKITVEVCCGSVDDVIEAQASGANRVELNSDLFHGGLTPTIGQLLVAKELTGMEIMTMVRPREGGFHYTEAEFKTALADAKELLRNGSDGIVFGFLNQDGTVDAERCRAMVEIAGNRQTVFHRAIDVVPDWKEALDVLSEIGVTRILTSGQMPNVYEGLETVAEMIRYARSRIEIMPGAGVTLANISEVVRLTDCTQIHIAKYKRCYDLSACGNSAIFFGGALYPPEDRYDLIDGEAIHKMCAKLQ